MCRKHSACKHHMLGGLYLAGKATRQVCGCRYVQADNWRYERIEGAGHWVRPAWGGLAPHARLRKTVRADIA